MEGHGLLRIRLTAVPSQGQLRTLQTKFRYFSISTQAYTRSIQLSVCRCYSHHISSLLRKLCKQLRKLRHQFQLLWVQFNRTESFRRPSNLTLQTELVWWLRDIPHIIDNLRYKNCYNWTSHNHWYQQVVQQRPGRFSIRQQLYVSRATHLVLET